MFNLHYFCIESVNQLSVSIWFRDDAQRTLRVSIAGRDLTGELHERPDVDNID